MGTVHIKNLSTLSDKTAALLAATYYSGVDPEETFERTKKLNVEIKKRGHSLTVVDKDKKKQKGFKKE